MKVIAGDIGGTNARLAIVERNQVSLERCYPSEDFDRFEAIFADFLKNLSGPIPDRVCLAIAGVVVGNRVEATNIPWIVDGHSMKRHFALKTLYLINDFEAAAWGITLLRDKDLVQIGGKRPVAEGPKAILGAGTGLGQAILVPHNKGYTVLPTEGGHVDLAPKNEKEIGLLRYLMREFPHVSVERILSGPGLTRIYRFLLEEQGSKGDHIDTQSLKEGDLPAHITQLALAGRDELCQEAVRIFACIYGAEAGNLALKCLATGGIYVAGGIAPKILPILKEGGFREAFESKGRMKKLLEEIPIYVVVSPYLGLLGAALIARQ
ncbi:MAG: glucokinase [Nitrospiraceae bacterium]|nr:glucokinase [Nitrospiraceae bacterium]